MSKRSPTPRLPVLPALPPPSCVGAWDSPLGLIVIFAVFFALRYHYAISHAQLCLYLIFSCAAVTGALEILRAPWRKRKPSQDPWKEILRRALLKYVGFACSVGGMLLIYWLFPEYRRHFYAPLFEAIRWAWPVGIPITLAYFIFAEWRIPEESDGDMELGRVALGLSSRPPWQKLKRHALGWLVKTFFFALMFCDLAATLPRFRYASWDLFSLPFLTFFDLIFRASLAFELVFVAGGYLLSCRLLNSKIRAVDETLFGWVIAAMSYAPFLQLFYTHYLGYHVKGMSWRVWLADNEIALWIWGSVILALMVLHMWCDACFGVRFSNLTHRGVITNGAYRFSKHPAYVLKNLRWWMVSIPFIGAGSWDETLRHCLMMLGVNLVYTLRSLAEERLLSQDPVYVAYARWIDRHGWLRPLRKLSPWFSYAYRYRKWKARGAIKTPPPRAFER